MTYETRTRFEGRFGRTAPCDLAIPAGGAIAQIVVAAKAFDSTGSKLTDAAREVEEMAEVRKRGPIQEVDLAGPSAPSAGGRTIAELQDEVEALKHFFAGEDPSTRIVVDYLYELPGFAGEVRSQ